MHDSGDADVLTWRRTRGWVLVGAAVLVLVVTAVAACIGDGRSHYVRSGLPTASIARFEMSHRGATLVCELLFLPIAVVMVAVVCGGVAALVARGIHLLVRSHVVDVVLAGLTIWLVVAGAVSATREPRDLTSVAVTGTHVELTFDSTASRLGLDDALVQRVPIADITLVDWHHDDTDAGSTVWIDLLVAGRTITVPAGSGGDLADTWELGRVIADAASVDMRCFRDSDRQPCEDAEARVTGGSG